MDSLGAGLVTYEWDGKVLEQVVGADGKRLAETVSNAGSIQTLGNLII